MFDTPSRLSNLDTVLVKLPAESEDTQELHSLLESSEDTFKCKQPELDLHTN